MKSIVSIIAAQPVIAAAPFRGLAKRAMHGKAGDAWHRPYRLLFFRHDLLQLGFVPVRSAARIVPGAQLHMAVKYMKNINSYFTVTRSNFIVLTVFCFR